MFRAPQGYRLGVGSQLDLFVHAIRARTEFKWSSFATRACNLCGGLRVTKYFTNTDSLIFLSKLQPRFRARAQKGDKMKLIMATLIFTFLAIVGFAQNPPPPQQGLSASNQLYDFQAIDFPGAATTWAFGINNCGDVVGFYFDANGNQHGFLFNKKDGFKTIDVPGAAATSLFGINDERDVVGGWSDNSGILHGVLIRGEKLVPINFPGGVDTVAFGINNEGDVVGAYDLGDQSTNIGFVLKKGQFTSLQDPNATPSQTAAQSIDARGRIVGYYVDPLGIYHGYIFTDGEYSTIDFPGAAVGSTANDINSHGQISGQYFDGPGGNQGYVLVDGKFNTIIFPNAAVTAPQGINDQGQLAGRYKTIVGGPTHAFIATPKKSAGR
jgi:probable HAF family extracellular repeat protein